MFMHNLFNKFCRLSKTAKIGIPTKVNKIQLLLHAPVLLLGSKFKFLRTSARFKNTRIFSHEYFYIHSTFDI